MIERNPCSRSSGLGVHDQTESVFTIDRNAQLYRRDLVYQVEYPTTLTALLPVMLFADLTLGTASHVNVNLIG